MKKEYALVTGGSSGIGQAACLKLAELGYNIIINYNKNTKGALETKRLVEREKVEVVVLQFDVSNSQDVKDTLEKWMRDHPEYFIEVLVNNAGSRKDKLMVFTTDKEWHDVIETNLSSFFYVTRPVLKDMVLNKRGCIINISSLSGVKGWAGQVHYAAAKAGLIGASKALAREVGKKNIRVNVIAPGFIKTKMISNMDEDIFRSSIALQRFGHADEVADAIAYLASDRSSFINGQVISVDGGDFHPLS